MTDVISGVRPAIQSDIEFLVQAIIEAETSGVMSARTPYETMFSLSRTEFEEFARSALLKNDVGHQLALRSFFVLEDKHEPIATCAAWIEPSEGKPSGFRMAATIVDAIGIKKWQGAMPYLRALSEAAPERTPGTLQMETFFVEPSRRGQGRTGQLIAGVRAHFADQRIGFSGIEIVLTATNRRALQAYERSGFEIVKETHSVNPKLEELTGSAGFIQLRHADSTQTEKSPAIA